jgi:uncharacterized RDD family membrane protein YckC
VIPAEEEYEIPESNWGRRASAYFVDLILIFLLIFAIFLFFIPNPLDFLIPLSFSMGTVLNFFIFWLLIGVVSIMYAGALEGSIGATVGKGLMGLEVFSLDTETMTAGKGFTRSGSKFAWVFVPMDIAAGKGKGDPRQRALDLSANTIVGDFIPVEPEFPERRGGPIYVKPIEPGEEYDEFADLPIPRELLSGNCPYCGTPYNIVPSKDKSTWSGLWNSRCIWCNHKVLEQFKRHVQPGKWI